MNLFTNVILVFLWGSICCLLVYMHIDEIKYTGKMDEFRKASLLKKIDLMFPKDDDDLLNAKRNWKIHTLIGNVIVLIFFIIKLFR